MILSPGKDFKNAQLFWTSKRPEWDSSHIGKIIPSRIGTQDEGIAHLLLVR